MRKKSHISLAGYLVRELELKNLTRYKMSFYFGSVLPDLNPRMFREPHEFDGTYEQFKEYVLQIVSDARNGVCSERGLWRRIGEALHYLADYFTYPHNSSYEGGVKGHCLHERDLKYLLRRYVRTPEALEIFERQRELAWEIRDLPQLFQYIESCHEEYLEQRPSVEGDCRWIVQVCGVAAIVMAEMACKEEEVIMAGSFWRCA